MTQRGQFRMAFDTIATRYDKLANTFLAAVALVCVLFWLN